MESQSRRINHNVNVYVFDSLSFEILHSSTVSRSSYSIFVWEFVSLVRNYQFSPFVSNKRNNNSNKNNIFNLIIIEHKYTDHLCIACMGIAFVYVRFGHLRSDDSISYLTYSCAHFGEAPIELYTIGRMCRFVSCCSVECVFLFHSRSVLLEAFGTIDKGT